MEQNNTTAEVKGKAKRKSRKQQAKKDGPGKGLKWCSNAECKAVCRSAAQSCKECGKKIKPKSIKEEMEMWREIGEESRYEKSARKRGHAVRKLLFAASFLSGYGVKVTLYATVPGRVQVWTSNEDKTVLKLLVKAANKEAGLPRDHDDYEMLLKIKEEAEEVEVTSGLDGGDSVGGEGGDGVGGEGGDSVGGEVVGGDGVGDGGGNGEVGGGDSVGGDGVGGGGGDGVGSEVVGGDGVGDGGGNGEGGDGVGGVKDGSKHGSAGGGVGSDGRLETESGDNIYMIEGVAVKERSLRDLVNPGDPDLMDLIEATERSTERFAPRGEAAKRKVLPECSRKTRAVKKKRQVAPAMQVLIKGLIERLMKGLSIRWRRLLG